MIVFLFLLVWKSNFVYNPTAFYHLLLPFFSLVSRNRRFANILFNSVVLSAFTRWLLPCHVHFQVCACNSTALCTWAHIEIKRKKQQHVFLWKKSKLRKYFSRKYVSVNIWYFINFLFQWEKIKLHSLCTYIQHGTSSFWGKCFVCAALVTLTTGWVAYAISEQRWKQINERKTTAHPLIHQVRDWLQGV